MEITLSTLRDLFGHPKPPPHVREKQFDYLDAELRRVAKKPWEEISDEDLWYYLHDLSYVKLQPDLFNYLFPVCLHFWYRTLMRDEGTDQGDANLAYSLHHGHVLGRMLDAEGREKVYTVIHDGFLHRLDKEGALPPQDEYPVFSWIDKFNSMGSVFPVIDRIWESWWNMETRGRAICALIWASGIICGGGESDNPLFWDWDKQDEYDRPCLRENDGFVWQTPWLQTNLDFLKRTLTADYLHLKMMEAAQTLKTGREHQMALELVALAHTRAEFIEPQKQWLLGIFGDSGEGAR